MADTKTYQSGDDAQPPARAKAVLRILYGLERGKRFELVGSEFTIGRGDDVDILLADPTIAEVHAVLYLLPTGARLRDAGSAAGLRVNGRIVDDEIVLHDGAQIEIGGVVLAFLYTPPGAPAGEAADAPPVEPPPPLPPGPPRVNPGEPAWAEAPLNAPPPQPGDGDEGAFTAADGGGPSVRIDTEEKQVRQVGFRGRGVRRIRIGSKRPIMTQLVSWFVILTVVFSAGWVFQTLLYDSVRIPEISSPAVAASSQAEAKPLQPAEAGLTGDEPPRRSAVDYSVSYSPSTQEPPDKARRTFDAAMRDYWNDNTDGALATLRELNRDHPDFETPVGDSVAQLIEHVEVQTRYRDAVNLAATVTAAQTATAPEMKAALEGLAEIPPTDPRFGPVAELYRQSLDRKLEALGGAGGADDTDDAEAGDDAEADDAEADDDKAGGAEDADEDDDFGEMDDDLSAMALDEDGEVVEERLAGAFDGRTLMAQAREEARRLYQEGRYKDAARLFGLLRLEDGLTRNQRDQCLYLERKLLHFGLVFEEGMNLVEDSATARQGIRRLESALTTDRVLFRFYERLLRKQISDAHAVLARDAISRGDLVKAGEHMESGLARDASRPAWETIKPEIAAMAMDHLDRARGGLDVEPARARRMLKQVVAAAPAGSPAWEEASVLLEALDRDTTPPAVPAEF